MPDKVKVLYDALSGEYDLGKFEDFKSKMSDQAKRKTLYEAVGKSYDLGSFQDFESKIAPSGPVPAAKARPTTSLPTFQEQVEYMTPLVPQEVKPSKYQESVNKDKSEIGKTLSTLYNGMIGSFETLTKFATELPAAFPITPYQFAPVDIGGLAEQARAYRDLPLEERLKTAKEGRKGIEEAFDVVRSGYTTRQEEQALKGQFDVMDGIGLKDVQALIGMSGGLATDMALGAATGGTTFVAQGMQNSYEDFDAAAEKSGYKIDPAARNLYGLAGGIINGVLEKFAVDKIVGDVPVFRDLQRKVIANVLKNTANVTGKRAVDAIEEAAVAEIRALTNNYKRIGYRALVEGGTEGAQAALEDGAKFAANAVQGNEVFNQDEIAKGFVSNVVNSAVAGGIFGPVFGAGADLAFGKNVNTEILTDISNAKTAEDLDAIRQELTKTFDENNFSQEERDIIMNNANRYAQIKQTIPEGTPALSQSVAIPKIEQRMKLDEEINKKTEYINTVDEAFRASEEQELSFLQDNRASLNDEIRGIVSNDVFNFTEENGKYYKSLEGGAKEEISKNRYDLEQIKRGNYATQTSEGKVQEVGSEGDIIQPEGTQTVQDQEADKANVGYRYIVGEEGDDVPVTALLNKKVRIKGQPAILYQQGQTVEARIIGTNRIIEIGNVNKLMNELPEAYEIEVDETLVTETPQGFRIEGQSLQNKNENPLDAIGLDQNGNVMNVVLTTPAGKRRKFRGQVAQDLAYQIQLKEILKDEEQFEEFLAREHQAELDAAAQPTTQQEPEQVQEPAQEQAVGANETISPRDVEPTYGRVTDRGADVRIKNPNRLQRKVLADARRVASALETLIPRTTGQTVQISLHDDSSFEEAVVAAGGTQQDATSRGFYMSTDGSIHLNMDNLDTDTVLHEGFHPVLDFVEATNPAKINEFYNKLASIPGAEAIIAKAKELYGEGDAHKKEAITDFVAAVADGRVVVNPSNFQKIKAFVLNLVKSLGIGSGQKLLNVKDETGLVELSKYITEQFTSEFGLVSIADIERFVINDNYAESGNQGVVAASGTINPDNIQQSKVSNVNPIQFSKAKTFEEVELVKLPVKSMTDVYNQFGGRAIAINSDPTKVGMLKMISGKEIFMYGGPNYTALKPNVDDNIGFASTRIQKPNQISKILNTLFSDSNGEGVVLVTTQAPESMLGNAYALEYTLDAISELPKSVLRTAQFRNEFFGKDIAEIKNAFGEKEYAEFVKKFRGADLSNPNVMNEMIQTLLTDVGNNFVARNALVSNMLAGIVKKSSRAGMKDQPGYISKDPNKFIAKQLMDRFDLNEEKLLYEIGENGVVKEFMDNGNWGFVTNGFASNGKIVPSEIQEKGVTHPQFNAKFYGKDPFILDGGYLIDRLFLPQDIITDIGKPYTKKASIMVAGSMYPKGPIEKVESPDVKGVPQFQKQYADEKIVTQKEVAPGKKLFNEPNPEAAIFEEEFKKSKGIDTPEPAPITKLDENKSKAIADVYDKLVDNPSDPEVQSAYQAMADETMEQYNAIKKSGVKVEIWDGQGEPYKNSGEMISDVRDNKHMYIFSTEEGFGDTPITDKQRQQNALLRDSGVKDINGKTMLINDIFRFVHDYFGHTRLGNSFGAIGEENAWNVHSRMYSPLARRAMTTETRGQNSWVNFNKSLRNADGTMKKKGDEGYVPPAQRPFADQKMALLPEQFSQIEEAYSVSEDLEKAPQFQKAPTKPLAKKGIVGIAKLAAKEQFRYGALGKEGVILKEKKAGELSAELVKAEKYAKDAILLTKKYKNSVSKTDVIDFMTGQPVQGNLPADLATALTNAREHVDNLTERLIQLGVIDDQETIDYYRDNKGKYLLRSYEAIDYNEKFGISQALYGKGLNVDNVAKKLKNVDKSVVDAALKFLADRAMAQNSSLSEADAMKQARIEANGLLSNAEEYVMQRGLTGSTNIKSVSERLSDKDFSPELRALMGEYSDPIYNYYASVFKIASLTSSRQYLNSMKDYGMGKFIFPYKTEDATVQIAGEGSKGLEPLNGMYTFPEIYEALKKAENDKPMLITQLAGRVRKFKTVYNPATHIKNVIGNTGFAISNGHWNYMPEAYKYMRASIVGGDDKDVMRMMDTLNRYGVLNNTLGIGELKQYFKRNENVDDFLTQIYMAGGKNKAMAGKVAETAKDVVTRQIPKFIEKAYQIEDDLFKILGFVNESNRYAKAIYQKPYQKLTEEQKKDIDGIASEIVKDTYPTFTRVPKFVKSLSKVLFMGNFLSFPVESVRVQYNALALARKEILSGNPRLKAVGASRIAGAVAYNSIFSSMVYYGFSLAGAGLTGMLGVMNGDDEDETENSKAIQRYVAPWNNNSDKYPTTFADGKLTYYDIGSLDSYSYQKRVWNAFWSNINNKEGFNKAISESMAEGLDPWLQRDFVLENFNKLMTNQNNSIYNPKDNAWKQWQDKSIFVAKQMGPGFVGASMKIADSYTKGDYEKATNEAYSQIVRRYDVDLEKQFKLFINVDNTSKNSKIGFKDAFRNTENIYKKAKESGAKGAELNDAYREAVDKYKKQIEIVRDYYNSAVRGGVPAQNLNKILNASGFKGPIKEGVIKGRFNFPDNMYIKK